MDRRTFLHRGSAFAAMLAAGSLVACGDDDDGDASASASGTGDSAASGSTAEESTSATDQADSPATSGGGRLRIAVAGTADDTNNPFMSSSNAGFAALYHLYDSLAFLAGSEVELGLAESIEPNEDGSEWTIVLKDATFHDGSPVTSADVAYTLRTVADPAQAPTLAQGFGIMDLDNIATPDDKTVVVPLTAPRGDFLDAELAIWSAIVPDGSLGGADAVGSGPFKLEAFEAGQSTRMVRNDDYWDSLASLDELELVIINDATARLNALKGGEVDFVWEITPTAAVAEQGNDDIVIHRGGTANSRALGFAANTTLPPFDNPDAVRALKLVVDRQAFVDTVLLGFGEVGNDLVGKGLPGFADDIQQVERNVDEARELFASAGITELTMLTGETTAGMVAAAELLVQQLAEVGVTLTLEELPADQYYTDFERLLSTPLQSAWYINRPADVHLTTFSGSAAFFNLTALRGDEYDGLLATAQAAVDRDERLAAVRQAQEYAFANDGMVIWGYQEDVNASIPGLSGFTLSQSVPRFHEAVLES
ncbi:MAG: ABC transporter substrate-binding protein [Actinomycetota bacterium]